MATVRFLFRSEKSKGKLTMRFRHYKKWDDGKIDNFQTEILTQEKTTQEEFKAKSCSKDFRRNLEDIEDFIIDEFDKKYPKLKVDKSWLQKKYDAFYKKDDEINNSLIDNFDIYINKLKEKKKPKNTIQNYKYSRDTIKKYNENLEIPDLTYDEFKNIFAWLKETEGYKISTAEKHIDTIRSVCKKALHNKVKLADDFDLKIEKEEDEDLDLITLTLDEIKRIEDLDLKNNYLINARKWLIIGVNTAQRGQDMLDFINKDNFNKNEFGEYVIDFKQRKTSKRVSILALPKVKAMYLNNDLPHKISLPKLNVYIKELCELAGIDEMIEHYKSEAIELEDGSTIRRSVKKLRPKYKYIASHCFRRTFCTIHHREMRNEEIMKFSGHKTNRSLETYLGTKDEDYKNWNKYVEDNPEKF
jgi:integrase